MSPLESLYQTNIRENYNDALSAVKTGLLPSRWKIITTPHKKVKTTYRTEGCFMCLYDKDFISSDPNSSYSRIRTTPQVLHEAVFEAEALVEHLTLLGRITDAGKVIFLPGKERAAIISPKLGDEAIELWADWAIKGMPSDECPLTISQFNTLAEALDNATHVNGDAGWYNLLIHPEYGPCFVDITSSAGEYENKVHMHSNLVTIAQMFMFDQNQLPLNLKIVQTPEDWIYFKRGFKANAAYYLIEKGLEGNRQQDFINFGIGKVRQINIRNTVMYVLEGNSEFYVIFPTEFDAEKEERLIGQLEAAGESFAATWGDPGGFYSVQFNRGFADKEEAILRQSFDSFDNTTIMDIV